VLVVVDRSLSVRMENYPQHLPSVLENKLPVVECFKPILKFVLG